MQRTIALAVALAIVSLGSSAAAEEAHEAPLAPRPGALSIAFGTSGGYALLPRGVTGARSSSVGVRLGPEMRLDPSFAAGLTFSYDELDPQDRDGHHAMGAGAFVSYHALPSSRRDPWLEIASGARFVRGNGARCSLFDLGLVGVGIDLRPSSLLSVGPFVSGGPTLLAVGDELHLGAAALAGLRVHIDAFSPPVD